MLCINPQIIYQKTYDRVNRVACGKCLNCKIQRQSEWTERLVNEASEYNKVAIVVLTYSDEHIPKGIKINGKQRYSLYYNDVQQYIKRLKRDIDRNHSIMMGKDVRYYVAGEYGEQRGRPHYHLILFGLSRCEEDRRLIDRNWQYGAVRWDPKNRPITKQAFSYVAGYVQKKIYSGAGAEYYRTRGIVEPFNYSSQGIGKAHAIKYKDYYYNNRLSYKKFENSQNNGANIPRYYIKLYRKMDRKHWELIEHRKEKFKSRMSPTEFAKYCANVTKVFMSQTIDSLLEKIREEDRVKKIREYKNLGIKTTYKDMGEWVKESWFKVWQLTDTNKMIYARMLLAEAKNEVTINKRTGTEWWPNMIRSKIKYEEDFKGTKEMHEHELLQGKELHRLRLKNLKKRDGID